MIDITSAIWLLATALFLAFTLFIGNTIIIKANGNILLGVTLPYDALKDGAVTAIVKKFRKTSSLLLLKCYLLTLPLVFISGFVSISMMYIFIWFTAVIIANQKTIRKYWNELYALKRENQWWVGTRNIVSVDTEVSRLKDTFPVSRAWFVIPLIISLFPIADILYTEGSEIPSLSLFGTLTVIFLFFIYMIYVRARTVAYSDNTEVNAILNRVYKREWTRCLVIVATVSSIFFTVSTYLQMDASSTYFTEMLIVIVIFTNIFIALPMVYAYNKVRNARNKFLRLLNEEVYTDDDE